MNENDELLKSSKFDVSFVIWNYTVFLIKTLVKYFFDIEIE